MPSGGSMRNVMHRGRLRRVDTALAATVTDSDGHVLPVVVLDISREGCRLKAEGGLHSGERIAINVDRYGSYPAQVRWAKGNEAGAIFLEPVVLP